MRRRLRMTYVGLLAVVVLGLAVPLALALAGRAAQSMYIDRLNDAAQFASQAEPAVRTGRTETLKAELDRYDESFGIGVAVVGRDGAATLASRSGLGGAGRTELDLALAGRQAGLQRSYWPWQTDPMVVALPINRDGEVIGAIVTVSPTTALRLQTGRSLAILASVGLLVLALGLAAADPLTSWLLRPVERLDLAAEALAEGRLARRVDVDSGPPELRRLSATFNQMADRIATLLQRQREFVSYASHQLRTPLATLRLAVENLDGAVEPAGRDDYESVTHEIGRLGALCDSLLDYARAEVTAEFDADRPVEAVTIVERRLALWRAVAERAGIRLVRAGCQHARVRAAEQALDQVVDALVSNAVKYAGRGAQVVVAVERPTPDWVEVHVVDDGPGMTADDLSQAGEAFWRHGRHRDIAGAGLGITIVDALVNASGGLFELRAAEPHGLHALIRLPAEKPVRATARVAAPGGPAAIGAAA
jgi:signal transduction histidine kinase